MSLCSGLKWISLGLESPFQLGRPCGGGVTSCKGWVDKSNWKLLGSSVACCPVFPHEHNEYCLSILVNTRNVLVTKSKETPVGTDYCSDKGVHWPREWHMCTKVCHWCSCGWMCILDGIDSNLCNHWSVF